MAPAARPVSSFHSPLPTLDALTTFYQLLSVLSLHYLVLCVFIPPALSLFSHNNLALNFEGGPAQVGMVLDWRELGSRRTFDWSPLGEDFLSWRKGVDKEVLLAGLDEGDRNAARQWKMGSVWLGDVDGVNAIASGNSNSPNPASASPVISHPPVLIDASRIMRPSNSAVRMLEPGKSSEEQEQAQADLADATSSAGTAPESDLEQWEWKMTRDKSRGWAIAGAWAVACAVDVFLLTTVVRRPKHILDHVVTLHLMHLLFTSWYSSSIPTSLFWWLVMLAHATACVLWAERVAIRTEMSQSVGHGLVGSTAPEVEVDEEQHGQSRQASSAQVAQPHVLFDQNDGADEDDEDERSQMLRKTTIPMSLLQKGSNGKQSGEADANGESIPMKTFPRSSSLRR